MVGGKKCVCGSSVPADKFLRVWVYGSYCSGWRADLNYTKSGRGEKFRKVLTGEKKIYSEKMGGGRNKSPQTASEATPRKSRFNRGAGLVLTRYFGGELERITESLGVLGGA